MSLSPEDEASAAEFALGTLDPGERASLAARRRREPQLDEAIRSWEMRLAPLSELVPELEPPADLFARIERRIGQKPTPLRVAAASADPTAALKIRLARWRTAALAASSLAAMLAIGVVTREATREAPPHEFVAVLQKSADAPACAVPVNLDSRELTVRPVSAPAPAGTSYELWIIDPKLGPPKSLGVIESASVTKGGGRLGAIDRNVVTNATYAVTVEPPGGSPDGKPSGAPVFVGKLIPVGP